MTSDVLIFIPPRFVWVLNSLHFLCLRVKILYSTQLYWEQAISEFQKLALSKLGEMQNLFYENKFYLHEY